MIKAKGTYGITLLCWSPSETIPQATGETITPQLLQDRETVGQVLGRHPNLLYKDLHGEGKRNWCPLSICCESDSKFWQHIVWQVFLFPFSRWVNRLRFRGLCLITLLHQYVSDFGSESWPRGPAPPICWGGSSFIFPPSSISFFIPLMLPNTWNSVTEGYWHRDLKILN